jgi:hypothetical protein
MDAMHRRFGLLYTLFSLLVLVVLVVLVIARVNTTREFNVQESQTSFIRLQGRLSRALGAGASGGESVDPSDVIREYSASVPTVRAIVVYSPENGLRYVWTTDAAYLDLPQANLSEFRGFPAYNYSEIAEYKISAPLPEIERQLYMDAIYRVLDFSDAYIPLRDSLISLVAFAFLTVLIAIGINASRRSASGDKPAEERDQATPRARRAEPAPERPASQEESPAHEPVATVAPPETHQPGPREPAMEEVDIEEIATDPGEPGTLFNPVTGLSYREHLSRRLGLELERSAFNDQDLTCMLLRFEDALSSEERYIERAQQVLSAFKFEDLCFEYGAGTICVILPNTELSRGIREAEAFKGDHVGRIHIGLSARNGRLVEASRVLGEADRGLEHAEKEPGGIVGFQPDPKKWRQYVTAVSGPQRHTT